MRQLRAVAAVVLAAALGALAVAIVLNEDLLLCEEMRRTIEVERRTVELHLEIERLKADEDHTGAEDLIRKMAALDPDHPRPYLEIARLYAALDRLEDAPAVMDALGQADGPARTYGRGVHDFMSGRRAEALPELERALDAYRHRDHLAGQAACMNIIGIVLRLQREHERAAEYHEATRPLYRRLRNRLELTKAHANLAVLEQAQGRPQVAINLLRGVVAVRHAMGDRSAEARALRKLASALEDLGDREGSVDALVRALALRRRLGDQHAVVNALRTLADYRNRAGDTPRAIEHFAEAAEIARAIDDMTELARSLRKRGKLELAIGRGRDALASFETLAALYDHPDDAGRLADARSWIGSALNRLGERERARRILEEVVRTAREVEDRRLEAAALTELGVSLFYTGDIPGAFLTQQEALAIHRELADAEKMLINQGNLAAFRYLVGDVKAVDAVRRTLDLARELGDRRNEARAHNNLGVVLLAPPGARAEADAEGARTELESAVEIWRSLGERIAAAEAEGNLAEAEARVGDLDGAAERVSRALAVMERAGDLRGQAGLLNVLGGIRLMQGRTRESVEAHESALSIARDLGLHDLEWRALAGLSEALEIEGRRTEATEQALAALDAVERARAGLETDAFKIRYLASRLELYERAIRLVLASPDGTERERAIRSFEIAERARARGLLDLLAEGRSALRDRMPHELRRREEALLDKINVAAMRLASVQDRGADAEAQRDSLEALEAEFEQLQVEVRRAVPEYGDLAYPAPATAERAQSTLEPEEVLLEYFVGRRSSWVWLVGSGAVSVTELSGLEPGWERDVSGMLADLMDPANALEEESRVRVTAQRLAPLVLPALPATDEVSRLIVVPDGALNAFPFELFPIGDELLVDRYEIGVMPSASTFATLRERSGQISKSPFLGIGAPVVTGGNVPPLPFARHALERIGRLFDLSDDDLLLGERATKTALRRRTPGNYRIIHIATHGIPFDDGHAGGLLLSGEAGDPDTILTAREIPGLELSADLVVLSSCSSGTGENLGGEGLVSLSRAFLNAGARAVVVSLWDVSDDSTADFMESFYRGVLDGRSPAAALRRAKLEFLHSDRPARRLPIRWAPFILVGEPDSTAAVNHGARTATVLREGD